MIRPLYYFAFACLFSTPLIAQEAGFSSSSAGLGEGNSGATITRRATVVEPPKPFSRIALGGGIGIMGINLQAATNVNRYANLRATGNVFSYSVNNITTNGFNASGKLDFATMGASFDLYPFPYHGFRLSPGVLFYNQNSLTASATVASGQSFKLNGNQYYSSSTNPVQAAAKLGLNAQNPAFTMTTGWGNMISRKSGHWSFPVELGAAFVGSPTFNMTLTGTACDVTGEICVDTAINAGIQNNLQAQIAKYKKDVDPLKVYPIVSFGVAYSFKTR